MVPRVVITGCARSGTKYMSRVLKRHGLDVEHERVGSDGTVDWKWAPLVDPAGVMVLHQVRHPLKVIASCRTLIRSSWEYISRHIAVSVPPKGVQITPDVLLLRCMNYWAQWNSKVERKALFRFRVEDLEYDLEAICSYFGCDPDPRVLEFVPKDLNTRRWKFKPVTWDDLSRISVEDTRAIRGMAKRYGYEDAP